MYKCLRIQSNSLYKAKIDEIVYFEIKKWKTKVKDDQSVLFSKNYIANDN